MFSLAKSTLPYFFKYPQSRVLPMTQAYTGNHSLRRAIFFITSSKESSSDSLFHKAFSYSTKREYSHTEAKHKVHMHNHNAIAIISLVYICVKHISRSIKSTAIPRLHLFLQDHLGEIFRTPQRQ